MKAPAAPAFVLGTLLLAVGCGGEPTTAPAPSTSGPATLPQPPSPTTGKPFEVTGTVTNDQGVPVPGAVVTMAHYLGEVIHWPSTVADTSGAYRISFPAAVKQSGFVARVEVVADGYALYWYSLIGRGSGVHNVRLYPIRRVAAGDSLEVGFPSDVGHCPGWVAERCGMVRVTVPRRGNLTVEVTPTDQSAGQPDLEICCVSGDEIYGNPLTFSIDASTELTVKIGLRRGSTAAESFVVKTSLGTN